MKLYVTPFSPYARMARIVVLEKGLADRVEVVVARTREKDSPYYRINPSGRVPYLVRDDGVGLEESSLICASLDHVDGQPAFEPPPGKDGWEARRLEGLARSMLDGHAVWRRELARAPSERSSSIVAHEAARSERLVDVWDAEVAHPRMHGALDMAQITLACALAMEARLPDLRWRAGRPRLSAWYEAIAARPSFVATAPPKS